MTPWYRLFLYFVSLPADLLGWLAVGLIRVLWGRNLQWETPPDGVGSPVVVAELSKGSWPTRSWYKRGDGTWGGTTLSPHAIFYGPGRLQPGRWTYLQVHEHVHVEQGEASMLRAFIVALVTLLLTGSWSAFLLIWSCGYLLMGVSNWFTAFFRGEPMYRGSHHEKAAYDRAELYRGRN